jgi:hypothetical protein
MLINRFCRIIIKWVCGATWIAHLASDQVVAGSNKFFEKFNQKF